MYPMYALAFNPTITTYVAAEMSIIKYRKLVLELHSKLRTDITSQMSNRGGRKVLSEKIYWIGFMFMLTFSVNFNVNIVGAQPFIQRKIAGGFYSHHSATFYVPLCDLFLNSERLQLKYLEVIWQGATSYLFSWHYQQFYK